MLVMFSKFYAPHCNRCAFVGQTGCSVMHQEVHKNSAGLLPICSSITSIAVIPRWQLQYYQITNRPTAMQFFRQCCTYVVNCPLGHAHMPRYQSQCSMLALETFAVVREHLCMADQCKWSSALQEKCARQVYVISSTYMVRCLDHHATVYHPCQWQLNDIEVTYCCLHQCYCWCPHHNNNTQVHCYCSLRTYFVLIPSISMRRIKLII